MEKKFLGRLLLITVFSLCGILDAYAESATYRITYESLWSRATHPVSYPPSAHYSRFVIASHSPRYVMFQMGDLSSPGVQQVAETGAVSILMAELDVATTQGSVLSIATSFPIPTTPSTTVIEIEVDDLHPLISAVSMIAPSPDWMVGFNNVNLLNAEGEFIDSMSFAAYGIDAGTDSGVSYRSRNNPTMPHETVHLLDYGSQFIHENRLQPFGHFTLQKITGNKQ